MGDSMKHNSADGVMGTGSAAGHSTSEFSNLSTQAHGYGVTTGVDVPQGCTCQDGGSGWCAACSAGVACEPPLCKVCGKPEVEAPISKANGWKPPLMCCAFGRPDRAAGVAPSHGPSATELWQQWSVAGQVMYQQGFINALAAAGVLVPDHQTVSQDTPMDPGKDAP
jgi:hypothetical protein